MAWTIPTTANARVDVEYDEVCCGGDCSYNRCLNYGDNQCCIDVEFQQVN
ncbi:hypothetical protein [Fodinibius saliphilus]|nr:hypothetical protein [Fodinibius saliphilus]